MSHRPPQQWGGFLAARLRANAPNLRSDQPTEKNFSKKSFQNPLTEIPNGCILYTYSRERPQRGSGHWVKGREKKSEKNRKNPLTDRPKCGTILTKGEANTTNAERVDTMEKITYVVALNTAIETLSANEAMTAVVEKLTALRDQQIKRNSAERKPTKAQIENDRLKGVLFGVLTAEPHTVTEIMALSDELSALSNQKVSALINALVDEGRAVKTVEKRKSYFARIEG